MCALLAGFLIAVPGERTLSNRFLAAFLLLTAIELSGWLWVDVRNVGGWANALRLALGTLQMPMFLGVFLSACYADFRLRRIDVLHLIPFLAAMVLSLPGSQVPFVSGDGGLNLNGAELRVHWAASHLLYFGYMVAVVAVLVRFRLLFRQQHSGGRSETLTWLSRLAGASLFAHTLILVRDLLQFTPAQGVVLPLQMVGALLALAITTWLAAESLLRPSLFRRVDRQLMALTAEDAKPDAVDLAALERVMIEKRPFLDAGLTLAALAEQLTLTPRELSGLINRSAGRHFFDFVNRYRVEHAKTLLVESPDRTVLEVLHDSGFNSKSSFNTAFKKHTGMTPTAFRTQARAHGSANR
ncbi:MAG: helix-turn-helix domain-containing protein [Myxococcota bacterium]